MEPEEFIDLFETVLLRDVPDSYDRHRLLDALRKQRHLLSLPFSKNCNKCQTELICPKCIDIDIESVSILRGGVQRYGY